MSVFIEKHHARREMGWGKNNSVSPMRKAPPYPAARSLRKSLFAGSSNLRNGPSSTVNPPLYMVMVRAVEDPPSPSGALQDSPTAARATNGGDTYIHYSLNEGGNVTQPLHRKELSMPISRRFGYAAPRRSHGVDTSSVRTLSSRQCGSRRRDNLQTPVEQSSAQNEGVSLHFFFPAEKIERWD